MRLQEFEIVAVADLVRLPQPLHDAVVGVGRRALVHHLGLALRVKILCHQPHDAQQLALPRPEFGRRFFEEIQDIFLRQAEQRLPAFERQVRLALTGPHRHRAPQIVENLLLMTAPFFEPQLFLAQVRGLSLRVTMHAMRHQRMRGVERPLHRQMPIARLARGDVVLGKRQIIENAERVGPLLEQVIVAEEVVMPEGGVGDDQRLHGRRIALHQEGHAGRRVDDDLVGEPPEPFPVQRLVLHELLAERPVLVKQRHADRGVGIEHLLGGNHLDLVGIDLEAEFGERDLFAGVVDALQGGKIPVGALEQAIVGVGLHRAATLPVLCGWNRSRNTGKIWLRLDTRRMAMASPPAQSLS